MRTNTKVKRDPIFTHEGGKAVHINPEQALRRSVMACMLWEDGFYESGEDVATRITCLCGEVAPAKVAAIAVEARSQANLRHAPLLLLKGLVKHGKGQLVGDTIASVIQRPDELAEFLSIYWKDGRKPLSAQMKKGLAKAFTKFNAYSLAKYNRDGAIKLRDVLFMVHAKPKDLEQAETWKKLVAGTLESPDTWEVELSAGKDKRATFERLIREDKLGYLALLRNLRNMEQAGCDRELVTKAILARKNGADRVLPFRFIAAARAAMSFEPALDKALVTNIDEMPKMPGSTAVLVDVSGSMNNRLSSKSDMTRMDAAAALGSVINGDVRVFTFSERIVEVPPRRGMAGVDAICKSQAHSGTRLGLAIQHLNTVKGDRLIVITDEQSHDSVPVPAGFDKAYMINVATNKNGVGYGNGWTHLDGFSESIIRYIMTIEAGE